MTWHHFFVAGAILRQVEEQKHKTQWHEAVSSALNFPFLKDVSQNCFVFDLVKLKIEEVSRNGFVLDAVKLNNEEVPQEKNTWFSSLHIHRQIGR